MTTLLLSLPPLLLPLLQQPRLSPFRLSLTSPLPSPPPPRALLSPSPAPRGPSPGPRASRRRSRASLTAETVFGREFFLEVFSSFFRYLGRREGAPSFSFSMKEINLHSLSPETPERQRCPSRGSRRQRAPAASPGRGTSFFLFYGCCAQSRKKKPKATTPSPSMPFHPLASFSSAPASECCSTPPRA